MEPIKKPALRFKGFEEVWQLLELSKIATMKARIGWQGLTTKEFLNDGNYYLITGTDFKNGKVDLGNCHYVNEFRYSQDVNIQVRNGDVLVTKDGTIGKVAYVLGLDKPATLNAGVFVIRGKDHSVSNLYLFHYLAAPFLLEYTKRKATGGTIKHLNQNILVDFPVPLPEPAEQIKIGELFKYLDGLIAHHQSKYDKLVTVKKAMLQKMFPQKGKLVPEIRFKGFSGEWEETTLGNLGSVAMNKRIFKYQTSSIGDVPFYKIGTFGSEPDAYISRSLFDEYKSKYPYPEKGDILISASGSIGRLVEYLGKDEYFQDSNIVWLKHDGQVVNSFLKQFYTIVKWSGLEGSTIKRLYNKNILETPILLPKPEEQCKIGNYFNDLDKALILHKQKLEKLQYINKACLERIFV